LRYNNKLLNESEIIARKEILFNIINLKRSFLNLLILKTSSGDLGLLAAFCLLKASLIVLVVP